MAKLLALFFLVILIFLGSLVSTAYAADFSFTDNFSGNYNIDNNQSNYKFTSGKISAPDNAVSVNVVSVPLINTYYNIGSAQLEVSDSFPAGGRIVYFVSNNNGNTWVEAPKNFFVNFLNSGNSARWMAVIARENINSASPEIHSIKITVRESGATYSNYSTYITTDFGNFQFDQNTVLDNEINSVLGRQVFRRSGFLATNTIINRQIYNNALGNSTANNTTSSNNPQVAGVSISKAAGVETGTAGSFALSILMGILATITYMAYARTGLFKRQEVLAIIKKHRLDKNRLNFMS